MKINKIKYLGACGAALLTIAPLTNSAVTLLGQSIQTELVRADDTDAVYQTDLNNAFKSSVSFTQAQLKDLIEENKFAFTKELADGEVTYNNTDFVVSGAQATDNLKDKLVEGYLKLFLNDNAQVKSLTTNYKVKMKITSTGVTFGNSADVKNKLKNLSAGSNFKIKLSAVDSGDETKIKAIKEISINVTSNPSTKIKLAEPDMLNISSTSINSADAETDVVSKIKDVSGNNPFKDSDIPSSPVYYYAIDGKGQFKNITDFNANLVSLSLTGAIVNQLIPIKYTNVVAAKYDPSSFVFLDGSHKITSSTTPGPAAIAYVSRKIKVGNPTYPVFKYTSKYLGVSSTSTIENGNSIVPGADDAAKLTYKCNDSASWNKLKEYLQGDFQTGSNDAGKLKAYKTSTDTNTLSIKFEMPDVKPSSTPQFVVATTTNKDNGAVSTIKIPIVVTNIPDPNKAPTVTKFPGGDVIINSKKVSKYDLLSGVEATFTGVDDKVNPLSKENIKITVKDSKNNEVTVSSDGTIPTTKAETYKVHYVFSNPSDSSKVTTRDLTVKVNAYDLDAPTVTGFSDDAIYTLSNNKQKEISPIAPLLGMDNVEAKFTSMDGKTYKINPSQISFNIKNEYGQTVELNSNKCIPMGTPGTYTVNYIWKNPEDESKQTTKTLTIIVNTTVSNPIDVKFNNNEVANPIIDASSPSFNVLANVSFNVSFKDPKSSTPDLYQTINVPNNCITVKVTKDGKDVPLTNSSFNPSEGTYSIAYKVVNPKDNAISINYTRTLTVKPSGTAPKPNPNPTPNPTPTAPYVEYADGVVWIDYVPGYGVNLWRNYDTNSGCEFNPDGSIRKLMTGSAWRYSAIATYSDGSTWYKLGTNQWVQGQYASMTPINNPSSWTITNQNGVGVVSYVPGYGINVWTSLDKNNWAKRIPHGSSWKYFKVATKDGKTMFNLGGDQWVEANYFLPLY